MLIICISHGNNGRDPFSFSLKATPKTDDTKDILECIRSSSKHAESNMTFIDEILLIVDDTIVKTISYDELHEQPNRCGAW